MGLDLHRTYNSRRFRRLLCQARSRRMMECVQLVYAARYTRDAIFHCTE